MNKVLYLVLSIILLCSCERVLIEEPKAQISTDFFYQDQDDALLALTAAYAQLKRGNGYYKQKFLSSMFAASDQGLSDFVYGDFKRGTITSTNQNLPITWKDIYIAIRDANNVIHHVPDIDMDEALKNRIIGEARFLRALHYFNLVRCFGEVPLRIEPIQPGEEEGLPLSSIQDIYEQIIEDLQFASEHCWGRQESREEITNDLGRVTNVAAHALLAKVYLRIASAKRTAIEGIEGNRLYMNFPESPEVYYQLAKEECDKVIGHSDFYLVGSLEEWVELFDANNGNSEEMLFDIQGSTIIGQGTSVSNLFSPRDAGLSGGGWGGSNKLLPKFINNHLDKNDPRYQNSIIRDYQNTTRSYLINPGVTGYNVSITATGEPKGVLWRVFTAKYIDRDATTEYTSQQNWHVIRLADVYLMRAEALAETSQDPAQANADINQLRNRVEMELFDGAGMSMDAFRTTILKERAAELYMEGHRFFDITRMGVYDEVCRITYGATDGARQANDYFWPIPITEVAANGNID
ncbi:MAG: RagB/SusD family nutrient uptake outer membrane protein [Bacteroidota bacterium]